ncbi:MAG: NAD/NADP octopine/nopaline dehydrogenase family protein [Alphaproteobacteria bacterium]
MAETNRIRVGIAGAGAIAFGNAALLLQNKHDAMLWSPSSTRTADLAKGATLIASGAVEGGFHPKIATDPKALVDFADVLLIALPAYGHKSVMDALAPLIQDKHTVIISSHASLGALYLSRILADRGMIVPIISWGTTITTGRQPDFTHAQVNTVRSQVDICTIPDRLSDQGLATCQALFGEKFVIRDGLLAISLSNLNPQNHMGIALANMTRMERAETWGQGLNITPNVGRLLEALDKERLAIAKELGLSVRTIFEHFHLSFHVPVASISAMNQEMHRLGNGGTGPATADSRYVTEDVPYGLALTTKLGEMVGRPAKLHQAGLDIFSAMYGRDFHEENQLLDAIDLTSMSLAELQQKCRTGFSPKPATTPKATGGSA